MNLNKKITKSACGIAAVIALLFTVGISATAAIPTPQIAAEQVTCSTNAQGICTVAHKLGITPTAIIVSPNSPGGYNAYILNTVQGSYTATNFKVRAMLNPIGAKIGQIWFTYIAYANSVATPPTTSITTSPSTTLAPTTNPTTTVVPSTSVTTPAPPASGSIADKYKVWKNGPNPSGSNSYFPLSVWMQGAERSPTGNPPLNGTTYKSIGIPQNVAMPDWPGCGWCDWRMQESIDAGWHEMPWISENARNLVNTNTDTIGKVVNGWTLGDEADQNKVNGLASDKPDNYLKAGNAARVADPTRPIYSNFGAAFANKDWNGYTAEIGSTYALDMRKYCDSSDIVSTDIYAYTNPWLAPEQRGAYYYGLSVDNIHSYCGSDKLAYGFLEASSPFDKGGFITPDQMEAAMWNMIVHNANGIVYFAHNFSSGGFTDDAMLRDPNIKARVLAINTKINSLASVLNSPSKTGVIVDSSNSVPVSFMYKEQDGSKWILAQADGSPVLVNSGSTTATFNTTVNSGVATVVNENRVVPVVDGKIVDKFDAYQIHIYKF